MRPACLVAACLTVVACARPDATAPLEASATQGLHAPRPALLPASDASDAAASGGVLVLTPGCVRVRLADGRHLLPGFLVRPVHWDAASQRLVVGAHRFADGDRVELGGSEAAAPVVEKLWVVPPAAGCDFDAVWITGAFVPD